MISALLRLPPVALEPPSLVELAGVVAALSGEWTVVLPAQRTSGGADLDEFVVASAMRALRVGTRVGVATTVGTGRAPSLLAREATTAQLLGACDARVLDGPPGACRDAAEIIAALFTGGLHTVTTPTASIVDAVNDPLPDVEGGPPTLWCIDDELVALVDGRASVVGAVVVADLDDGLPAPVAGTLVDLGRAVTSVARLAAAMPA